MNWYCPSCGTQRCFSHCEGVITMAGSTWFPSKVDSRLRRMEWSFQSLPIPLPSFICSSLVCYQQISGLVTTGNLWNLCLYKEPRFSLVDLLSAHPFPTKHGCMMCFDLSYMTIKEQPSLRFLTLIGSCLKVNTRFWRTTWGENGRTGRCPPAKSSRTCDSGEGSRYN